MLSDVEIYLCRYEHVESAYLRHFVCNISYCNLLGEESVRRVEEIIGKDLLNELLRNREVIITDTHIMKEVLTREPVIGEYLVLKKKM
ncbi:MAG: hypothetical protein QXS23_04125 [Desulfurococcaceae archaeon]